MAVTLAVAFTLVFRALAGRLQARRRQGRAGAGRSSWAHGRRWRRSCAAWLCGAAASCGRWRRACRPGRPAAGQRSELPVLGGLDDVLQAVTSAGADAVVVTGSLANARVQHLTWALEGTGIDVFVVPAVAHQAVDSTRPVAGLPLVYVNQGHALAPGCGGRWRRQRQSFRGGASPRPNGPARPPTAHRRSARRPPVTATLAKATGQRHTANGTPANGVAAVPAPTGCPPPTAHRRSARQHRRHGDPGQRHTGQWDRGPPATGAPANGATTAPAAGGTANPAANGATAMGAAGDPDASERHHRQGAAPGERGTDRRPPSHAHRPGRTPARR